MTRDELAKNDGRDGRPAYAAVNGTIYDFTASPLWKEGAHQGVHQAGRELGEELKGAPHVRALIERFPVIGHIEEQAPPPAAGGGKGLLIAIIIAVLLLLAVLFFR